MNLKQISLITVAVAVVAIAIALVVDTAALAAGPAVSAGDQKCQACHSQAEFKASLPSGELLPLFVNTDELANSVHNGILQCSSCHRNYDTIPHPANNAANLRQMEIAASQACQACHPVVAKEMQTSIHNEGKDGPAAVCVDCHGAHNVQKADTVVFRNESLATCTGCHGNADLMTQYGISTDVVSSYLRDFHGKTNVLMGKQSASLTVAEAVCTDCHGVHNIESSTDPNSAVIKENLANTCRKCHPGASDQFASAWLSHKTPSPKANQMVFLARLFYAGMIPFVVGGLLIHIGLDVGGILRRRKGK